MVVTDKKIKIEKEKLYPEEEKELRRQQQRLKLSSDRSHSSSYFSLDEKPDKTTSPVQACYDALVGLPIKAIEVRKLLNSI